MLAILASLALLYLGASVLPSKPFTHGSEFCTSGAPSAPTGATNWGFSKCLFYVKFTDLTKVDLNNTKNCSSGYAWFTNLTWFGGGGGDSPTPSGNMSINANGMGLLASTNTDNLSLLTAVSTSGAAYNGSYCGYLFDASKGFFVQMVASLNSAVEGNPHSSFWMMPLPHLNQGITTWVEDDIMEVVDSSGALSNLHQWTGASNTQLNAGCQVISGAIDTALHTYAKAIVPMSLNSGTGRRESCVDGVHKTAADVTYTSSASAPCSTGSPTGVYSVADTMSYILILGGPFIAVQSVQVWGPP